jgi:hypothetical protein
MDIPDTYTGQHGTAHRIPAATYTSTPATLDAWILTAPGYHPAWTQYLLALVTLADMPGIPTAHKQRPDTTHELIVMTLDPHPRPYDAPTLHPENLRFLLPVNISEQVTATDDQARELTALCARAVCEGLLNPETADAPTAIRARWSSTIQQTIAHDRDPHHGRLN